MSTVKGKCELHLQTHWNYRWKTEFRWLEDHWAYSRNKFFYVWTLHTPPFRGFAYWVHLRSAAPAFWCQTSRFRFTEPEIPVNSLPNLITFWSGKGIRNPFWQSQLISVMRSDVFQSQEMLFGWDDLSAAVFLELSVKFTAISLFYQFWRTSFHVWFGFTRGIRGGGRYKAIGTAATKGPQVFPFKS